LIRGLAAFGRADQEEVGAVDVHRALDDAVRIAENRVRHRARLTRRYGATAHVRANELQIGQVFVNLLVNAADAIPEGAVEQNEVTIETANAPDGRVIVRVSDTGAGIPKDVQERIFDPFFTTKPVGAGTGLGLSICHRIVTSLGGEIAVESELGRGSTFRVLLRSAESSPARAPRFVGDDEPSIAKVIKIALAEHDVTIANDGEEARRLCSGAAFDCILCDIMMPGVSGPELWEHLRADGRGLERRVVFMTGGAFAPRAAAFLASVSNPCLEKPFRMDTIESAVRDVLRANARESRRAPAPA
jgi:CheY-like chemotaxis protein/two-component sensor histidine kinase